MRQGWIGVCLGLAVASAAGAETVDPRALERQLSEMQTAQLGRDTARIVFTLNGCEMRRGVFNVGSQVPLQEKWFWLGDLQTDPALVRREDDPPLAGGSWGPEARHYAMYYWRMESLITYEDDIIRWLREFDRIDEASLIYTYGDKTPEPEIAEKRRVRTIDMQRLYDDAMAGKYGPMMQRNQDTFDATDLEVRPYFMVDQLFPDFWFRSERAQSPFLLVLPRDSAEAVLNDLHRYAVQVCP